jgi:hypothetical protein
MMGAAMQMSVAYTGNLRTSTGYSDHRGELVFDYGLSPTINWTVNASGDFTDRKGVIPNSSGGRFATDFQCTLVQPPEVSSKSPLILSFGGEGDWMTKQKPQYTGQIKLSFPIVPGVDFPIAYRYANRAAQLNKSNSEAHLGPTFDVGAITKSLK